MFEVECPSCHAGYKVDERRIPATGLKMRCPKCGESFQVSGAGPTEPPVLGAALGIAPARPPVPRPSKRTMMGLAPAHVSAPAPQRRAAGGAPGAKDFELADIEDADLPDVAGSGWEADLPVPAQASSWPPAGTTTAVKKAREIDLFGDSVAPPVEEDVGGEFELPSPSAGLPDLPRPGHARRASADLPDLVTGGLPSPSMELPSPVGAGLPSIGGGLPSLGGSLPSLGGSLPSLGGSLPAPMGAAGGLLPSLNPETPGISERPVDSLDLSGDADDGFFLSQAPEADSGEEADPFGDGPRTSPRSITPRSADGDGFEEVDLGEDELGEDQLGSDDVGGEFDAFPTEEGARRPARAGSRGADNYGDVSLDDGEGGFGLDDGSMGLDGEVDRAPAPRGPAAAASAQVELPRKEVAAPKVRTPRSGLSRGIKVGIAAALLLTVAGGALGAFLPDVGPYGAYLVLDLVKAESHAADLGADIKLAREALARDTALDAKSAFQLIDRGRSAAPRYRPRLAYAAYAGLLGEIRFGVGSGGGAAAKALIESLSPALPDEVEYLELARLASGVASGASAEALRPALIAKGADYAALVGEAALLMQKADIALQAFTALSSQEKGARAHFGLARAHTLLAQSAEAEAAAERVLAENPGHLGARLLLAQSQVRERSKEEALVATLVPISKGDGGASVAERTQALVLLGEIHMARGRLTDAEAAFAGALGLQSGNATAQRGLADALFESGRFSEAQTRYEAALKTDSLSLSAGLGLVRCRIRLEELETASTLLAQLKAQHSDSTALQFWSGRVEEQLGHRDVAQVAYEAAIKKGDAGAELVKAYIALTRILGQDGKASQAEEVIREAEAKFPNDPLVFEALAELASSRGSYETAVRDYERALALDPNNVGLHFAKAIALRQGRRFEDASRELDVVEGVAKNHPGLALERGNLLEASGRSEEALAAYEKALAEAPDSLDMMLRVGCARASAGQGKPAVDLLKKVFDERPNSAEVNFCLGLGYLRMPPNLQDARRYLQRAVGFDASRANYHLYVGWAAIDMGDFPLASVSLDKALELDRTLADAYWKRGELRVKQGAVDDAVRDLSRALELSPSRYEAYAQLGLAYLQNGREPQALEAFRRATEQPGVEPYYNYRYGELLLNNRSVEEAQRQLALATEAGAKVDPAPTWLWEAHRLLAMALGRQKEALEHWKVFAEHAPSNSPYLAEATREMDAILRMTGH